MNNFSTIDKMEETLTNNETTQLGISDVSGSLTHIPIFQYNTAVEAHNNTLELLKIIQGDKEKLKAELEAAHKEIENLRGIIINYR